LTIAVTSPSLAPETTLKPLEGSPPEQASQNKSTKPRLVILDEEASEWASPSPPNTKSEHHAPVDIQDGLTNAGVDMQLRVLDLLRDRGLLAYPWALRNPSPSMPSSIVIVETGFPEGDPLAAFDAFRLTLLSSSKEPKQLRLVLDCQHACPLNIAKARLHAAGLISITPGERLETPCDGEYTVRYEFRVEVPDASVFAGMQAVLMHRMSRRVVYVWKSNA
jgi:hypothetical protein